jgi:hypothetical protein
MKTAEPLISSIEKQTDMIVVREAQELGLIDEKGFEIVEEAIVAPKRNLATEVKRVKLTRQQKLERLNQRTSIMIGMETKDPDYVQYRKHLDIAAQFRAKLERKFQSRAKMRVREMLAGNSVKQKLVNSTTSNKST